MFELGDFRITEIDYFGHRYDVWCVKPVRDKLALPDAPDNLPASLSVAYGGSGVERINDNCTNHT